MKVPFRIQTTNYTCGPAVLQMVFEYFGLKVTQKELIETMQPTPESGTPHDRMISAATSHGFFCYVNNESDLSEVKFFLSHKLPVIAHFIEPSYEEGHYAVITAYRNKTLIFNDPWNGKNSRLSEKEFKERWCDEKSAHKNWIMVLSTEDFHLGKQFLPQEKK